MSSPLRYPGSKASLVNYIAELIKENYLLGCHLVEPYAGSAVVSLELLHQGVVGKATLVEKDPLIFSFWHSVFNFPETLIEDIHELKITIETWQEFQKYRNSERPNDFSIVKMGLAGLFFNRTNYSGIINAGPIGGIKQESEYKIDCRFNKERLIKQIYEISKLKKHISVIYDDALLFLRREKKYLKNEECFLYLDPPYYERGKDLYRYWYSHEDHKNLAKYLMRCDTPWLVSYDNHEKIRNIYSKAATLENMHFDYTVSRYRKETELLISNLVIPPGLKESLHNLVG